MDTVVQFPAWRASVPLELPRAPVADIGDLVTAFYPFRALAAQAVRGGEFPLWNPNMLGGAPFLANSQSALFYPLTAIYYGLGLPAGWTVAIILRMFLAAWFMWLFARSIGATSAGAITAGIVFSMCGFVTAWQGQAMGDAAIWLPLIFYAVRRLRVDPSRRSIALTAFAFAMPVLAGHPETAAHLAIAGTAWALWSGATDRRFTFYFALAGLLAIGLSGVQTFATLEWLKQIGSVWDSVWPALAKQEIFGFVSRDILRSPNSAGVHIPEAAAYVGMMSLLLAPLGALYKPRRNAIFLSGMVLISCGIAFGIEPLRAWTLHIPVVKVIKNWRAILLADFGLAAMAGLGGSYLQEQLDSILPRRKRLAAFVVTVAAFVLLFLFVYQLQRVTSIRVDFLRRPSFSRALLFAGFIPIVWRLAGGLRGQTFATLAAVVVSFDMITFAYGYTTFASRDDIFPQAPVFDFLKAHADPFRDRVAAVVDPYPVNSAMMYGLAAADGYEVKLLRIREFCQGYSDGSPDNVTFGGDEFFRQDDRRLDLLNIRYFVVYTARQEFQRFSADPGRYAMVFRDANVAVFENRKVLPRAFAVPLSGLTVAADDAALAQLKMPAFDPERTVVLSQPLSITANNGRSNDAFQQAVDVTAAGLNRSTFRSRTSEAAVLVVSQIYYPGWKAFVDGDEADVLRADYALTGVVVPAGTHEVRLVFAPQSFRAGLGLTLFSAAFLLGLAFTRPGTSSH